MMVVKIVTSALAIFVAIVTHEMSHAFMAHKLGDNTAKHQNRLSFNPFNHVDIFGTIVLPILLFISKTGFIIGWAKPVPIDYSKFKQTKRDIFLVASAGVVANILLAIISSIMLKLTLLVYIPILSGFMAMFWLNSMFFNIVLAAFNILPIPPLDGAKMIFIWFNNQRIKNFANSDYYGLIAIVIIAFIIPAFLQFFNININPIADYLRYISSTISNWLI